MYASTARIASSAAVRFAEARIQRFRKGFSESSIPGGGEDRVEVELGGATDTAAEITLSGEDAFGDAGMTTPSRASLDATVAAGACIASTTPATTAKPAAARIQRRGFL